MEHGDFWIENGVLREYRGPGGAVDIPEGVVEIGRRAFSSSSGGAALTAVTLPAGLRRVGTEAFSGCAQLERVVFPAGLAEIGDFAFAACRGLTDPAFPAGLRRIERSAFSRCTGLKRLALPAGLEELGEFAFAGCWGLTELSLPAGLRRVERSAFSHCRRLARATLPAGLETLERGVFYGCAALTEVVLPADMERVSAEAFSGCDGLLRIVPAPENPYLKETGGVLYSGDGTRLLVCPGGLQEVTVPEGVTEIGPGAFLDNGNLDRLTLPQSLRRVGASAFVRCTELTELALPAGLEALETSAFEGCAGLRRLTLPDALREIGDSVFRGCTGLQWLRLPAGIPFALRWFSAPNDSACFSADRTEIPFVTTREAAEIDSAMGLRRAALGFIRAEMDGVGVSDAVGAGYTAYLREHAAEMREELLSDDDVLRWMTGRRLIPREAIEGLLEAAAERGRTSASVLLLDYQSRFGIAAVPAAQPGGQLDQRFAALETALEL